jgi:hypothetical protein
MERKAIHETNVFEFYYVVYRTSKYMTKIFE